ncbi:hypothetical protein EUGRSUZ_J00497 [Eucalyptus grandis]|uniref:glucan endo-1,3-beta-D-glucosidase n=2 Tax=Eucalyptus grandis TaxID=71139 RepID=A0A059ABV4_EUCGR|nr:hypothetical protein EUGRSUZ_J00497 [Eucalyptus grandis]
MASSSSLLRALFLLLSLSDSATRILGLEFGINYGQIADDLPSPSRVATLLGSLNVSRVKLYDADPNVLQAFSNSNVDFIIGIGNDNLQNMTILANAQDWIQQHVQPYIGQTQISCIVVGNEVLNSSNNQWMPYLVPAMKTVYSALSNLGLNKQVAVTTAHSLNILATSYPPSAGWPSKGDDDEAGATLENAHIYNENLLQRIEQKQGTPAKPSVPIDIYVFALFNENLKPGPTSERNYGLYYPDGTPVYSLGLQGYLPELYSATGTRPGLYSATGTRVLPFSVVLVSIMTFLMNI